MLNGSTRFLSHALGFATAGTFFLSPSGHLWAQEAPPSAAIPADKMAIPSESFVSLDECIGIAMDRQPSILAARASMAAAIDKRAALINIGIIPTLLTPEMSIRKEQTSLGVLSAEAQVRKAEHETRQAVTYSYLMAVYAAQQHNDLNEIIENTKLLRKAALVKAERFPGQLELVDIALAATESRLPDAENGKKQAIAALREAMGTGDAVTPVNNRLPKAVTFIPSRDEAVSMALANRPEIRQASLGEEVFGLEVSAQEKNRFSRRLNTLGSATDIHAMLVPSGEFVENYRPGALAPEMPTILAGRRQDRVNQANDLHLRAVDLLSKVQGLVELEAGNVWLRWDKESRKGPILEKGIDIAEKRSEQLKKDLADVPRVSPRDVLEAGLIETTLKQQKVEAQLASLQALAVLERATGNAYRLEMDWSKDVKNEPK